jgi:hypothetical protein
MQTLVGGRQGFRNCSGNLSEVAEISNAALPVDLD